MTIRKDYLPTLKKDYLLTLICNDNVNEETLETYKQSISETIRSYDPLASVENINCHLGFKVPSECPIGGFTTVNIVEVYIKLSHTENLGTVINNILRKYSNNNDSLRARIMSVLSKKSDLYNIDDTIKSIELINTVHSI